MTHISTTHIYPTITYTLTARIQPYVYIGNALISLITSNGTYYAVSMIIILCGRDSIKSARQSYTTTVSP